MFGSILIFLEKSHGEKNWLEWVKLSLRLLRDLLTLEQEHIHVEGENNGCHPLPAPPSAAFAQNLTRLKQVYTLALIWVSWTGEEASGQREEATCPSHTEGLQLAVEGGSFPCRWINMTFRDTQTYYWLWVFLAQHEALFVKSPAKWKQIPSFPLTFIKIEMFLLKRPQQPGLPGLGVERFKWYWKCQSTFGVLALQVETSSDYKCKGVKLLFRGDVKVLSLEYGDGCAILCAC